MSENIFTSGEPLALNKDYLDRFDKALREGYRFDRKSIVDIDELPTATTIKAKPNPIDNILQPDPDNKLYRAYVNENFDDLVTPDAIDYFTKNPSVTSVDFTVSYPGYTDYDYHPLRTSDLKDGFLSQFNKFSDRSSVFAGSLKDRIRSVNEVIDANPKKYNPSGFIDDSAIIFSDKWDAVGKRPATKRINFTPEDSKRLSKSLNKDLTDMFKGAPERTTFVNNPDTPSRGKLYTRFANFSPVDEAGNQFVVTGPRGSLQSLQITDPDLPALGPSNFDTNPSFGRTIREMIDPDSVEEIRKLPAFQRSLYQKPSVKDLTKSATRFAGQVKLPKVPPMKGTNLVKTGLLGDALIGGFTEYLTNPDVNELEALYSGAGSLIPESGGTAPGTFITIDGKNYTETSTPGKYLSTEGPIQEYGIEYLNDKPQMVRYGQGQAGMERIDQSIARGISDLAGQAKRTMKKRLGVPEPKGRQPVLAVLNNEEGEMLPGDPTSFRRKNWSEEERMRFYRR